jgi:hypothetical protein
MRRLDGLFTATYAKNVIANAVNRGYIHRIWGGEYNMSMASTIGRAFGGTTTDWQAVSGRFAMTKAA